MIIVHNIIEPFAAGITMLVKSHTEAMSDDMHIIVRGGLLGRAYAFKPLKPGYLTLDSQIKAEVAA